MTTSIELGCTIDHDNYGNVLINFDLPVEGFTMPPERAVTFAMLILQHAQRGGMPTVNVPKREKR